MEAGSLLIRKVLLRIELLLRDCSGVAHHVTCERTVGIRTLGALRHAHTGKLIDVLNNVGNSGTTNVARDGVGALGTLGVVLDVAEYGNIGHAQHVGKMTNDHRVLGKIAIRHKRKRSAIVHNGLTVAIEDASARSGRGNRARLILLRELVIMVGGDHLHAPQLGDDSGKNRTDTRGEQFEASIRLRAGRTALTLGGARSGTVGGIKGELTGIALEEEQRSNDGDDEDNAGDDNE